MRRLIAILVVIAILCLEHDGRYASSTGHTSTYDCSLNEYYENECALTLDTSRGALAPSPASVPRELDSEL